MPGHVKLGKPGTPDEDPTQYLASYLVKTVLNNFRINKLYNLSNQILRALFGKNLKGYFTFSIKIK